MNVSGDFLCISETSDGIGISCIVAVKEESEMLAGAETLKLVSILSEFISAILCLKNCQDYLMCVMFYQ